jgi:hypothetical protein
VVSCPPVDRERSEQAFTHLALIQAVLRLDDQLDRRRP